MGFQTMDHETFSMHTRSFDENVDTTLNYKGDEYSTCGNRMWNFHAVAKMIEVWLEMKVYYKDNKVTPAEAAWLLSLKHDASIIKQLALNDFQSVGFMQEKFGDKAAYNKLVHGMVLNEVLEKQLLDESTSDDVGF